MPPLVYWTCAIAIVLSSVFAAATTVQASKVAGVAVEITTPQNSEV